MVYTDITLEFLRTATAARKELNECRKKGKLTKDMIVQVTKPVKDRYGLSDMDALALMVHEGPTMEKLLEITEKAVVNARAHDLTDRINTGRAKHE